MEKFNAGDWVVLEKETYTNGIPWHGNNANARVGMIFQIILNNGRSEVFKGHDWIQVYPEITRGRGIISALLRHARPEEIPSNTINNYSIY